MMAFYKLFYIIHRRTDFYRLWRWADEMMHPEYYAKMHKDVARSMTQFMAFNTIINNYMRISEGRTHEEIIRFER